MRQNSTYSSTVCTVMSQSYIQWNVHSREQAHKLGFGTGSRDDLLLRGLAHGGHDAATSLQTWTVHDSCIGQV